mmetsp:Transcript_40243/g.104319  ORF Transcript_40243/g.104319 Transcript_40243/m.104319 type:complete len:83 (+) Transcript_40243:518-766(+)
MGFSVPVPSNVIWTQSDIRGRPEEDACGQRRWNRRIRMLTGPQSGNRKFQAKVRPQHPFSLGFCFYKVKFDFRLLQVCETGW